MGYMKIPNLCKDLTILDLFKELYYMEKIHGSSANVRWAKGKLHFHAGGVKHERFVEIFDHEALTKAFEELGHPTVIVYGEVYGGKLQRMSTVYGKELRFVAFEVKIGETWLNVPNAHDVVQNLGLEFVDYVRGPATPDFANEQRDRPSVQAVRNGVGDDKWREGVVIRPLIELKMSNGKRLLAKHRRPEARETKTDRELSPEKMKVLRQAAAIADEWVTENRLAHVLQHLGFVDGGDNRPDFKDIPAVKDAMLADVKAESEGEIEWSKNAERAVKTRAVEMFKKRLAALK